MDISYIQKLLENTKSEKIILRDHIKFKIETLHNLSIDQVFYHLKNPKNLILVQEQESTNPDSKTFRLIFKESENKKIVVVITERSNKEIFIVTAFQSTKKAEKLIRKYSTRRR